MQKKKKKLLQNNYPKMCIKMLLAGCLGFMAYQPL